MIIGITGKSGAGKSTLSKLIKKFGANFEYIDFDSIAHQTLDDKEVQDLIKRKLDIEASSTNRKKLADIIFNSQDDPKTKEVTTLMWIKMKEIIDGKIADKSKNYIFDWILLPKTHYFKMCDIKILMKACNDFVRKIYASKRDNLSTMEMRSREMASIEYNENDFTLVIKNNYFKMEIL